MLEPLPYLIATHDSTDWPEWGSAPRGPLLSLDMAHRGELLATVVGDDVVTGEKRAYYVLRCEMCILTHIWPLLSEGALADYYRERFYTGPAAQEVTQHERDRAWYEQCVYAPIFDQCERILHRDTLRVLDVGAGSGLALDIARQRGWYTVAIEPDKARSRALAHQGHLTVWGTLQEHRQRVLRWAQDAIDVCMLWETLEHQPNPEAFLLDLHDVLPQDALLVISVPNDWSPLQLAACAKYKLPYYFLIPPIHINYFSPKCLQLLVRRCGYKILDLRGTYPLEHLMLEDGEQCYVGNSQQWRLYTDIKNEAELHAVRTGAWAQLEATYRSNIAARIGRSIVVIAQKE